MTALKDLLAKVEAGVFPVDISARDLGLNGDGLPVIHAMYSAFSGHLDAALALHEALRPGQPFNVSFEQHADGHYCVLFGKLPDDAPKWTFAPKWEAKTPLQARSLLACELRALIAQEGEA